MQTSFLALRIQNTDNVAVILADGGLPAGSTVQCETQSLRLLEAVPQAHKVALRDLAAGDPIIRYGVPVGYAKEAIRCGSWVSEDRVHMPASPVLDELRFSGCSASPSPAQKEAFFDGYVGEDGRVGTRNILAIGTTVQCVAGVVDKAVERIRAELLPRFPYVDDVVAVQHIYGCGVAIEAPHAPIPIRTLRNLMDNPNFGERLLVGLGCEKLLPQRLFADGNAPEIVCLQDEPGFEAMLRRLMKIAAASLERLNQRRRRPCSAAHLRVGMQCGGSDAFSGMTANPAMGRAADRIVQAGGTVFFSEVTEVRDGIAELVKRAATPAVAEALVREMRWYDTYLANGGVDRSANTTPGNKKGGLNNITEKSMGSIAKSGTSPIAGVLSHGEALPPDSAGLYFVATPASDFVCGTLQLAAGMNVHVFSTGRGTPYNLREVPVVKVSTRTELATRWPDLIDVNAGRIAEGECTVDEAGEALFRLLLDVASGRKTCAETLGISNSLALFNPAPIT